MKGMKFLQMTKPIENPNELIEALESNTPDVYIKCTATLPDKKGKMSEKLCILNLKTGDIFKNRKLNFGEESNHKVIRNFGNPQHDEVSYFAFQNAQVIDDKIVLATWVFGDYVNQPGTSKLRMVWYGASSIESEKKGSAKDPNAIKNIALSEPKVVAIVTVSKDKEICTWENLEDYGFRKDVDGYLVRYEANEHLSKSLLNALHNANATRYVVGLTESFKKCFCVGYAGANRYLTFDTFKDIPAFMKASTPKKGKNKNQELVDKLNAIKLPDHTITAAAERIICFADRFNDEWTVLRWHAKTESAMYIETCRMYVNKTEALHCRSDLNGGWIHSAVKLKAETFNANRVIAQSDDVFDGTKLEYFKNISADMSNQSAALYMLTMYPEFEKMYKIGLDWLCDEYLKSPWQRSWKNYLEDRIGHVDWDAKNIMKMIGVNRHQLEVIRKTREQLTSDVHYREGNWQAYYVNRIIGIAKNMFNVHSLSSIDDTTFDYIIGTLDRLDTISGMYPGAVAMTFRMYPKDAIYFIKDLNSVMKSNKNTVSITSQYGHRSYMSVDRMYSDTLRMIETGAYQNTLRPRFSTIDELIGHHQIMVDLVNADRMRIEARANASYALGFTANLERWKKWEYDGDAMFCVVAPVNPIDVAAEGIALRHCVKSYIPAVAKGETNIMFIRLKGKEDDPFFTVEVDRSNNIRQVHGMCNCNVDTVDGLTEFVKKWAKLNKLRYAEREANGRRAVGRS